MFKYIIGFLLLGLFFFNSGSIYAQNPVESKKIKVGVYSDPPFVIKESDGGYRGLSLDLWNSIADSLGFETIFKEFADEVGIIRSLDYGELEAAINPLHVSSLRVGKFEVSQPYFISSIGMASVSADKSQFQLFLSNFFSIDFFKIIALLFFILFFFGALLWRLEKKSNQYQFRPGIKGLFDGFWWSAVTMTTVGYGDKAPKTSLGKTIAVIWMFTAVIIISSFTATIASTLTVDQLEAQIESLEDLYTVENVGTVGASAGEDFLNKHEINIKEVFNSPLAALRALARKDIEILVYDKAVMEYLVTNHNLEKKVTLLPVSFGSEYQSFMFPRNSPYVKDIDQLLIYQIQEVDWQATLEKYNLK